MDDPTTTRMIQTRDGVARVPRTQQGTPLRDYLRNTELPADLDRAVIYDTPQGPVAAAPDPVAWNESHDLAAADYADRLYTQIEDKGYYKRSLARFAETLSEATGHPREEMKAVIVAKFVGAYGAEPYVHLQALREAQGLPTRAQDAAPQHEHEL